MNSENLVALPLEQARELLGDAEISVLETAPPRGREELGSWRVLRAREANGAWELMVACEQISEARRDGARH